MKAKTLVAAVLMMTMLVPTTALAAPAKKLDARGKVPAKWDLPKPPVTPHPDVAPPSAGGSGDGVNNIAFGFFDDGDMIVTQGTATGHAGEWDSAWDKGSLYDKCVWSANTVPVNGVQREEPRKYRAYDSAYGLWVPSVSAAKRVEARNYCRAQNGEPYDIASSKTNQSRWYCSKLAWASYKYTSSVDLDANGGTWVWPIDLVNDSQSAIFARSN